jgi:hypothetical protein
MPSDILPFSCSPHVQPLRLFIPIAEFCDIGDPPAVAAPLPFTRLPFPAPWSLSSNSGTMFNKQNLLVNQKPTVMLPKEDLLKSVENQAALNTPPRVLDQAEQAIRTWEIVFTDFLSPPEFVEAQEVFRRLTEVHFVAWGGYPQAERQRGAIARAEIPLEPTEIPLALVWILPVTFCLIQPPTAIFWEPC